MKKQDKNVGSATQEQRRLFAQSGLERGRACAIRLSQLVLLLYWFFWIYLTFNWSVSSASRATDWTDASADFSSAAPFEPAAIRFRALFVRAWKSFNTELQPEILRKMSVRKLQTFFWALVQCLHWLPWLCCIRETIWLLNIFFYDPFQTYDSSEPLLFLCFFFFGFRKMD